MITFNKVVRFSYKGVNLSWCIRFVARACLSRSSWWIVFRYGRRFKPTHRSCGLFTISFKTLESIQQK